MQCPHQHGYHLDINSSDHDTVAFPSDPSMQTRMQPPFKRTSTLNDVPLDHALGVVHSDLGMQVEAFVESLHCARTARYF